MIAVRTTITIDDATYREAKASAARSGRTVGELIEDAVRAALRAEAGPAAPVRALPTFGHGGVLPGVDLEDRSAVADLLDGGRPLDALR